MYTSGINAIDYNSAAWNSMRPGRDVCIPRRQHLGRPLIRLASEGSCKAREQSILAYPSRPLSGSAAMNPTVSVIMPTYNQAHFIRRALLSLCNQTLREWELIIIDDASTDETQALIRPYLTDERIRCIRLPENRPGQGTGRQPGCAGGLQWRSLPLQPAGDGAGAHSQILPADGASHALENG
jgi:hypothetical protein